MGFRGFFAPGFENRSDAGRQLAALLDPYAGRSDVLVLALPRGGVPVGFEVAERLRVPLFALIVRKLGAPGNPELAIGAITSDGTCVVDRELVSDLGVDDVYVRREIERQKAEIERRLEVYGTAARVPEVLGREVILVDDGVATGSTVRAALRALRSASPGALIVAVPVGAADVLAELRQNADSVVAVKAPDSLFGVGAWYDDFRQIPDQEVIDLLKAATPRE